MGEQKEMINVSDDWGITMEAPTTVTSVRHFTFTRGGVVVGTLDAVFDFADLPEDLHHTALGMIHSNRVNLLMPTREREEYWAREAEKMREREENRWWKKFGRWLKTRS